MHKLIITGLANIGIQPIDRMIQQTRDERFITLNIDAIMHNLELKNRKTKVIKQLKENLLKSINDDFLLKEFRKNKNATLSFKKDEHGRCLIKENDELILTCSKNSRLGEMCIAYCNLSSISENNYSNVA